jgi:hypothetical protein
LKNITKQKIIEMKDYGNLLIEFDESFSPKLHSGHQDIGKPKHCFYVPLDNIITNNREEFENIIKARARGIEIIGDKRPMKLNNLWGIHGHEYIGGISAPVNPARGLFLKAKVSTFQGHNHQTSEHTEPTLTGKMVTTWSLGCLSELHPAYMPLNKWNHGFAEVDLDANGEDFEFRNKRIFKGKIV